ncbi:Uncharacterised protein [Streptococcus pneumoniae]|nr:Uncharacterised protein [Streptococcus pneumoniae]
MSRFFVWNRRYSKMKQEQDKSIRTVKSISNNILEVDVYYSSFNPLYDMPVVPQKEPVFFSWLLLFYPQNSILGFLTNNQNAIFHICFQMFSI